MAQAYCSFCLLNEQLRLLFRNIHRFAWLKYHAEEAKIQKIQIEHVTPRPDFVGKLPTVLEWTAAAGVDTYSVTVENEIEMPMLEQDGITTTSLPWPKELKLDPGTYFWRIVGRRGDRSIADSGRAAFLVRE